MDIEVTMVTSSFSRCVGSVFLKMLLWRRGAWCVFVLVYKPLFGSYDLLFSWIKLKS
jgi:hypothetical protein